MSRLLAIALLTFVAAGCSDPEPTVDATTTIETAPAADALEAERTRLQADLDAAQAQNEIDSLRAALDAAQSSPANAPTASSPAPSGGTASGSASPGLRGLPPADGGPELFSGSKPFRFCETYRQSAVERYEGMELCYEGTVRQQGDRLIGSGRKSTEDGRALAGAARTPIQLEGYVYTDYTVRFNYTVRGERRATRGSADLDGDLMNGSGEGSGWPGGSFQTDAANSSGDASLFISNPVG